jgi:hypothetical protein
MVQLEATPNYCSFSLKYLFYIIIIGLIFCYPLLIIVCYLINLKW